MPLLLLICPAAVELPNEVIVPDRARPFKDVAEDRNSNSLGEIVDANISCGPAELAYSLFRFLIIGSIGVDNLLLLLLSLLMLA